MFLSRRTILIVKASLVAVAVTPALEARAADPTAVCITENEHSLELRKQGKLLEARRELAACAAAPCPDAIQQACRSRIANFNAAIPSIVFDVKDASGQDLLDVEVSIDGQAPAALGVVARQVDPGPHVFRFETAGRPAVEKGVVLREGEKERRESIVMGQAAPPAVAPASPAAAPAAAPAPAPAAAPGAVVASDPRGAPAGDGAEVHARSSNGLRLAGWIAGGTGIVAMAASGALALVAKSSYEGAEGCNGTVCTTEGGYETRKSARTTGDVATVVLVAGAAATAVGVVLWIAGATARETAGDPRWRVGLTPGGAVAEGRF